MLKSHARQDDVSPDRTVARTRALRFVLLVGVMSLFSDFTYEGSRSIVGPYMATLGAGALAVGVTAGFGELLGYSFRLVSGRLSDRSGQFWPITIIGYVVQMSAVPLLAVAGTWQLAAVLVVLERLGKATRNPPRDVMLSHAGAEIGYGWAFGLHEALDQSGAMVGPLAVSAVLAIHGKYETAFAFLAIPAVLTLSILAIARLTYPRPHELESHPPEVGTQGLVRAYWLYLIAAALVATGYADFSLIAFRFHDNATVSATAIPIFYAVAMAASGAGSLLFGRLFDRSGLWILIPLTAIGALFAPLVFLGGAGVALLGIAVWGLGMGVHESIIPAAVAHMVSADRRATAYGTFTAAYGVSWFAGSAIIGLLYGFAISAVVVFCIGSELAAIPVLLVVLRVMRENAGPAGEPP